MSMSAAKLRAMTRFRLSDVDALLPPPLPLINLPDEVRLAHTGVPGVRPTHLPVRRHRIESSDGGLVTLKPNTDGTSVQVQKLRDPEPILRESRMLVESEAEEGETREIVARVHVYEYNQPEVQQNCGALEDTLVFDSLFESGNLQRAERIYRHHESSKLSAKRHEYELTIHPDIKNSAYRQWFYFEVRNGKPGVVYKFSLVNLAKSGALFGNGLQPVVYSEIDADTKGVGWVHRGTHVRYDVSLSPDSAPGTTCLSFQCEFEHEHDRVYFACLQPYTYTDLTEYLEKLERDPERAAVCRRTELCQSIAQNPCDLLSITSSGKDGIPPDEKRVIVLSARVHPGESNSSWMMKGMIDYLTGPSSGAQILRKHFLFKVVSMLNPDGVINGNTRVNLAGWDLNRKWSYPVEKLFPTVYHLKRLIANLQARDRVAIYCDLHGHSLNRNIFTYGCYNKKSSKKLSASSFTAVMGASSPRLSLGGGIDNTSGGVSMRASVKNDPRVFPMIVAKNSHFFSFASCDFKVHKSKLNTARVVVNYELGVINSYTLEASFCGPDFGPRKDTQFSTWDLEEMGKSWCQSLLIYFDLVVEVKVLDAAHREEELLATMRNQKQESSSSSRLILGPDSKLVTSAATTTEMTSSLLSDCEAAISELFANIEVEYDDELADVVSMDSDLSGAEDEPIPPNQTNGLFDGYSSAPEDGNNLQSPDKASAGGSRRRKSHNGRKKSASKKNSNSSSSNGASKRSKSKAKKKDKFKTKEREQPADQTAVVSSAVSEAVLEPNVKKKSTTSGGKQRRKTKSSSGKKERSRSFHGVKSKPVASDSEDEGEGDEEGEGEDEEDNGVEEDLLAYQMASAPARVTPLDVVVLPICPGSVDRRRLKTAPVPSDAQKQQRDCGGEEIMTDDQFATDDQRFLCPTPPSQRGKARLVRTGSPPPIELPLVKPLPVLRSGRGGDAQRGSLKEQIMEAYGLTGRIAGGAGASGGHHSNYSDDNDVEGEGNEDDDDSDASSVQSGPESYLSEF